MSVDKQSAKYLSELFTAMSEKKQRELKRKPSSISYDNLKESTSYEVIHYGIGVHISHKNEGCRIEHDATGSAVVINTKNKDPDPRYSDTNLSCGKTAEPFRSFNYIVPKSEILNGSCIFRYSL